MLKNIFSISLCLLGLSLCLRILTAPLHSHIQPLLGESTHASHILLITAHPDDECMFFAPTIASLVAVSPAPELYSLCLSVGDADGLGKVRRDELSRSLDVLHVKREKRWLVDNPELQDNFTLTWDPDVIANTVKPYIMKHRIDTILTFDYEGISSHPNHQSIPHGVAHLLQKNRSEKHDDPLRAYGLVTVPLIQKYIGPVSALLANYDIKLARWIKSYTGAPTSDPTSPGIPVFVSGITQYLTALRAMRQHRSQLIWFRWLYITFSRYMWVNEWVEILPSAAQNQR